MSDMFVVGSFVWPVDPSMASNKSSNLQYSYWFGLFCLMQEYIYYVHSVECREFSVLGDHACRDLDSTAAACI